MSRYSPIAPITLLEQLYDKQVLGNYLLLLAEDVLDHPSRYEDLVLKLRGHDQGLDEEDQTFIIMDNCVCERGEAMHANDVIEAACVVEANCIQTPDAMGGFEATVVLVEDQSEVLENSGFPLMKVPQGATYRELQDCIDWLNDYFPVDPGQASYWGIPRWIANELGSRIRTVNTIRRIVPNAFMHLLGMSKNYQDDMTCSSMPRVIGMDSANPLVNGQWGRDIATRPWIHMDRNDYWDHKELTQETILNVEHMHNVVGA